MTQRIRMFLLVIAVLALAVCVSGPASAEVLKWKMVTSWPAGIPLYTDMAQNPGASRRRHCTGPGSDGYG